ncbi:MAG: glycosyltransferase family 4 protein, partial [Candidatus Latescibacteria bacterium]|nr:glycosyltransferase family 4 protein [Candidatus Latescibacterota bacterium]
MPGNLTLIPDPREAAEALRKGAYDLVVCHTLQDLAYVAPFSVPTIYLSHNALHNDGLNDAAAMAKIRSEVSRFLEERNGTFAAISPMKLESWGMDGFVIRPGINLGDYGGYTGEEPTALAVGNLFVERDHMLGYRALREIVEGLPHRIVGENPSLPEARKADSWETLKAAYRTCRVYVSTTMEAYEDGYNLGTLEAMATGMPLVSLANASSPVVDGECGFVSGDPAELRGRVESLLEDVDLARRMGAEARRAVAERFAVKDFVEGWNEIFEACLGRSRSGHTAAGPAIVETEVEADDVALRFGRTDVYPYTPEDVADFLGRSDPERIAVPKLKLDRVNNSYLCDLFLYDQDSGRQMSWQGIEVHTGLEDGLKVVWPPYLAELDERIRNLLEGTVKSAVEEVQRQGVKASTVDVNLSEVEGF